MNSFHRLLRCAAASALLWVSACGDLGAPVASTAPSPEGEPRYSTSVSTTDLSPLAKFNVKPQVTIAWAKKWIGPEGGRLDFEGFAIDVPPGAVDKVTQFSIHLPVDPQASERVLAEFRPHGAQFLAPVGIEFPFRGTSIEDSTTPAVIWWSGSQWVDMGGASTADGLRLRTTTDHFSEFGTTTLSGGVTSSGG